MIARVNANEALIRFGHHIETPDGYTGLMKVLGIHEFDGLASKITEDNLRLCELLAGPHGYAIYKMLLLRLDDGNAPL